MKPIHVFSVACHNLIYDSNALKKHTHTYLNNIILIFYLYTYTLENVFRGSSVLETGQRSWPICVEMSAGLYE